jgi:hypothetical protein
MSMFMPPEEADPTVVRTRKTVEIIRRAGLETQFDALVMLFTDGDMLGFIAGCRLMVEEHSDNHEVRAAILHNMVGTAFIVGAHYALERQQREEAFMLFFREMTALPLNHPAVMEMVARHRAEQKN